MSEFIEPTAHIPHFANQTAEAARRFAEAQDADRALQNNGFRTNDGKVSIKKSELLPYLSGDPEQALLDNITLKHLQIVTRGTGSAGRPAEFIEARRDPTQADFDRKWQAAAPTMFQRIAPPPPPPPCPPLILWKSYRGGIGTSSVNFKAGHVVYDHYRFTAVKNPLWAPLDDANVRVCLSSRCQHQFNITTAPPCDVRAVRMLDGFEQWLGATYKILKKDELVTDAGVIDWLTACGASFEYIDPARVYKCPQCAVVSVRPAAVISGEQWRAAHPELARQWPKHADEPVTA